MKIQKIDCPVCLGWGTLGNGYCADCEGGSICVEIPNGYDVIYNDFYRMYQISHAEIGSNIAEFKTVDEVVHYCNNG